MTWEQLTSLERNALVGQTIFGYQISWRVCARDPENGCWEEIQYHMPDMRPGQVCWHSVAEMRPCYNWLDTDGPIKNGWDMHRLAEYRPTSDYDAYWRVVPDYAQDIKAAWQIVEYMTSRMSYDNPRFSWDGPTFKPEHRYLTNERYPLGTTCWYVYLEHDGYCRFVCTEKPEHAICKAGLFVFGVEV